MSNMPVPQQIYRHFKGNLYRIITLARHSETDEELADVAGFIYYRIKKTVLLRTDPGGMEEGGGSALKCSK